MFQFYPQYTMRHHHKEAQTRLYHIILPQTLEFLLRLVLYASLFIYKHVVNSQDAPVTQTPTASKFLFISKYWGKKHSHKV